MEKYLEQINNFQPTCEQEAMDKEVILKLIDKEGDNILSRDTLYAHITSSGLVLNNDFTKVLMVYHNIYNSWAWTGGHADGEKDLFHVALREVQEETGVKHLRPLSENIVSLEIGAVKSHYKKNKYVNPHLHLNVTYVFIGDENEQTRIKEDENSGVMWIDVDKLDKYCNETQMVEIYKKIIASSKKISEAK